MKKTYVLIALVFLATLVSCGKVSSPEGELPSGSGTTLETNSGTTMANLSGSVVIDTNPALAGKTLNFEVEMMKITKSALGTTADTVEKGDQVEVHYTGKEEDTGTMFDTSRGKDPLAFTVGIGQMIPGFDAGVVGMKIGEKKTLILAPKDAYGEYDETKKQTVPKSELSSFVAAGYKLEVGEKLPTQYGEFEIVEVIE